MTQTPSTPVKVPSSAANYTPATLDPDLRSQINTMLLREGHVTKYELILLEEEKTQRTNFLFPFCRIQETLLHSLNSHSNNWPTAVQSHALSLLRSGEVTTFPALLRRVLEDVRQDSSLNPTSSSANGSTGKSTNGEAKVNGSTATNGTADKPSLAIPDAVIQEALRVTRESLEDVCEIEERKA